MLAPRLIPVLLIRQQDLIKTVRFRNPRYVGDPVNAIRIFNEKEVDEIIVIDVDAAKTGAEPNYRFVELLAGECFVPLAYGGGIRDAGQARRLFNCGIEKVSLNSAALDRPSLITELSEQYGSQAIVASVDLKRTWYGALGVYDHRTGAIGTRDWIAHITQLERLGAGEVFLNFVDQDGTFGGPNLQAIERGCAAAGIPVIACGGIRSLEDVRRALDHGASAVAAGSFFVFYGPHRAVLITYPSRSDLDSVLTRVETTSL